jgi:hypothetical protein
MENAAEGYIYLDGDTTADNSIIKFYIFIISNEEQFNIAEQKTATV